MRRNFSRGRGLLRVVRPRGPGVLNRGRRVRFNVSGFWSEASGKLCMVGAGVSLSAVRKLLDLSAVVKLNYPKNSSITNVLVTGTVESLDSPGSSGYFGPISLLAYSQSTYEYTLIPQAKQASSDVLHHGRSLPLGAADDLCSILSRFTNELRLFYRSGCPGGSCSPLGGDGAQPSYLSMGEVQCSDDGHVHMYMVFSDSQSFRYRPLLNPEKMLVAEGLWDHQRNHLSIVACQVQNPEHSVADASVGGCKIVLGLWFPGVLSIESRSPLAGRIWASRNSTDPFYFEMVDFRALDSNIHPVSGLKYEYTMVDLARKSCGSGGAMNRRGRIYPDAKAMAELTFDMGLRSSEGTVAWAYAHPVSVGDAVCGIIYGDATARVRSNPAVAAENRVLNVSYRISGAFVHGPSRMNGAEDISAEGTYNEETGRLCLMGCLDVMSSRDCRILIEVQLAPLNPEPGAHVSGAVRSMRNESDPFYFKPLEISSNIMYRKQAAESIWRMDLEAMVVLISLSLSCVFTGLQLFHVREHPNILPSTSITMLVLLTMGHMIPLMVNFGAFFLVNHSQQDGFLGNSGWLGVNEVVVKLITMVAVVLHLRLLQLAWSARSRADTKKGLWHAERRALRFCLPFYLIGLLISWFVHLRSYTAKMAKPRSSIWEDLISYAGLLPDGFLLPQILLNVFWGSKEKALIPAFYLGNTMARALPHIYDAYRVRHYVPQIDSSYLFADAQWGFYSSSWSIIIPSGGVLLAVLLYFQQRFGGSCILPARFRNSPGGYETISTVKNNSTALQIIFRGESTIEM